MQRSEQHQQRADCAQRYQHERQNTADPVQIRRDRFRAPQQHEPAGTKAEQVNAGPDQQQKCQDARDFHFDV